MHPLGWSYRRMPSPSALAVSAPEPAAHLLLWMRAALLLGETALLVLADAWLGARLPWTPLAALLGLHLTALLWGLARRRERYNQATTALQLAIDASMLAALVYFTGGYANPFISLLLVPLILGAVLLAPALAWGLAGGVAALYTLLMSHYQPLAVELSDAAAVDLHLRGMWLNFLLTAALVAAFTGALAQALRRRDAELAAAREQRLRDEQLFALGLQAATAAHELATPLASVRLTLDDLRADYAGDDELAPGLDLMHGQLQRVEATLARLAGAARAREARAGPPLPARRWIDRCVERWGLLHPQASVVIDAPATLPMLEDDPMLEAVLMTLLNNAQAASPGRIELAARSEAGRLCLEVTDAGPGLGGKPPGWGVGLDLARAALERLGGRLSVAQRRDGGVLARAEIPVLETP